MGSRSRIRWPKVAKLALGVLGCLALFGGLPSLIRRPEPPPLESDIGLAPLAAVREPAPAVRRQARARAARRQGPRPARRAGPNAARWRQATTPHAGAKDLRFGRLARGRRSGSGPGARPRSDRRRAPGPFAAAPDISCPAPSPSGSAAAHWPERVRIRALIVPLEGPIRMPNAIPTGLRGLVASMVVGVMALGTAGPASAGAYRAAVCNPRLDAGRADATFERSSRRYLDGASCRARGRGLMVSHERGRIAQGRWGAWSIRAPSGTAISRLSVYAAGRTGGGNVAELAIGTAGGPLTPFATPGRRLRRIVWSGSGAAHLAARLRCRRTPSCGHRREARIRVKRIIATLDDRRAPTLSLAGSLFAAGSRRGSETIQPLGADVGGGVRRLLVQVNGEPATARTVPCRLVDRIAVRLRPCPGRARASFGAATASPPFRQGPNVVRVCAADYAPSTAANRTCAKRRVRIDNLCPISEASGGATLHAHLRRTGSAGRSSPVAFSTALDAASPGPASASPPAFA